MVVEPYYMAPGVAEEDVDIDARVLKVESSATDD